MYNKYIYKLLQFIPILLLFFISLNGSAIINIKIFSVNIHYIMVYYLVLRQPQALGYGLIFLAGVISDVVLGLPLGVNALSLLFIAAVAAYVRVLTVRITLLNDWISFLPALMIANLFYYLALYYTNYSIEYFYLIQNSIFTFIFYPVLWIIFTVILKLFK